MAEILKDNLDKYMRTYQDANNVETKAKNIT